MLFVDRQGNHHYDRTWKKQVVAAALKPDASLSRVAIDHGINTNLVRKWVRKHKAVEMEAFAPSPPSTSAFIPVRIEPATSGVIPSYNNAHALDLAASNPGAMQQASGKVSSLSSVPKLSVTLPNGVTLSLECDDLRTLKAVIEAVSDV
ncbi:IS66-like element accessory protein TnpA [Agrobacterium tumefaciens]|uniref:IS66-like element accessory protein TnpA n=1 Tax=Agrobacterium tumefaciens TaxID=358 RepID=UPI00055387AB